MKKVISNIISKWYIYLIAVVISSFSIVYITNLINMPRNEEVFEIFVASTEKNVATLNMELNKNKPSYLRKININTSIYSSSDYDYMFTAFGKDLSDLIILPESKLNDEVISYYYSSLNEEYIEEYISSPTYYCVTSNGKNYGIKIRNKGDTSNTIISFCNDTLDEDYYAFFYSKSLHAGKNNGSNWNTSLLFTKLIMEYSAL